MNSAQTVVDQTNTDATQANQTVANAQAQVDHAQDVVDGKDSATVQQNLATAQQDLSQAQTNVKQANDATKQASQAVSDAQTKVTSVQTSVDQANQAQSAAQQNINTATQAQAAAQKALDDASQHQGSTQTFTLGTEYVNALKAYNDAEGYNLNSSDPVVQRLIKASDAMSQMLKFQSNAVDKNIKINGRQDLTPEVLSQLSTYAAQLINSMRDEFGAPHVIVTNGSVKFAGDIADEVTADQWILAVENAHDVPAINRAAAKNGLFSKATANMYEDAALAKATSNLGEWHLTLDDFKQMIFTSLQSFMANDEEWSHANSILGAAAHGKDQYFGVSFSDSIGENVLGAPGKTLNFDSHFAFVPQDSSYWVDESKFDKTAIKNETVSANEIKQLESDLATKKTATNTAKTALATANTNTTKAQNTLTAAKTTLATAKQQQANAQTTLTNAQAAVKTATAAVAAAQKAVDETSASDATKQQALSDAKAALKAAQAVQSQKQVSLTAAKVKLATANQALAQAKAKLANAEAALKAGQQALANKKVYLNSLTHADANLAAAKQAAVDAQAAYDQAVQALKVAQTTADSDAVTYQQLQQVADVAKQVLVAVQAKLDQLLQTKALNDAIDRTNQETSQSKSAQGESMTNTEHATTGGDTVTLKAHRALSAEQATTLQQRKAAMAAATTKSTSTLPQTNETADRIVSVLGLMVIGLVGLLGVTKRRKRI